MDKIQIFAHLFYYNIRARMTKPKEFILEVVITLLSDMAQAVILLIILQVGNDIAGWKNDEIMLLYGFTLLTRSIAEFFTGDIRSLGSDYIRKGKLDSLLIRPVSCLFQLMIGDIKVKYFGSFLLGLIICIEKTFRLRLSWVSVITLFLGVISSVIISISISTIIASTDFWFKSTLNAIFVVEDLKQFTCYPLKIYPIFIRFIFLSILPFAFMGYVQVAVAINKMHGLFLILSYLVSILVGIIAVCTFNKGLSKYESIN